MNYTKLADKEVVDNVITSFVPRNFEGMVVNTKEEALQIIKDRVPQGASVMNGSSRTLETIGLVDYLKTENHGWNNLHEKVLNETDPAKQAVLRRETTVSDYYLGSAHAVTEDGELFFASNTGSQLPALAYTAQNIILVVGTHKIVPTITDAYTRLQEHIVPLEDENMMQKYGVGTQVNKLFTLAHENPMFGRKILVIFVNEVLGF